MPQLFRKLRREATWMRSLSLILACGEPLTSPVEEAGVKQANHPLFGSTPVISVAPPTTPPAPKAIILSKGRAYVIDGGIF